MSLFIIQFSVLMCVFVLSPFCTRRSGSTLWVHCLLKVFLKGHYFHIWKRRYAPFFEIFYCILIIPLCIKFSNEIFMCYGHLKSSLCWFLCVKTCIGYNRRFLAFTRILCAFMDFVVVWFNLSSEARFLSNGIINSK